jgi:hypothetical protein
VASLVCLVNKLKLLPTERPSSRDRDKEVRRAVSNCGLELVTFARAVVHFIYFFFSRLVCVWLRPRSPPKITLMMLIINEAQTATWLVFLLFVMIASRLGLAIFFSVASRGVVVMRGTTNSGAAVVSHKEVDGDSVSRDNYSVMIRLLSTIKPF